MLKPAYQIYFKYGVFNPYIVIDEHGYDGNHINGIIYRQSPVKSPDIKTL